MNSYAEYDVYLKFVYDINQHIQKLRKSKYTYRSILGEFHFSVDWLIMYEYICGVFYVRSPSQCHHPDWDFDET